MGIYNIMTCSSPPHTWGTGLMSGCSKAWLILGLLFFIVMIIRRQTEDGNLGINYNVVGAGIGGLILSLIAITLFGDPKLELLGGIIGIVLGGFVLGHFTGSSG